MKKAIAKNIMDLHFQKHLIVASTAVVVAFTYIVGMAVAVFARQIPLNGKALGLLLVSSGLFLSPCVIVLHKSISRMHKTLENLRNLE